MAVEYSTDFESEPLGKLAGTNILFANQELLVYSAAAAGVAAVSGTKVAGFVDDAGRGAYFDLTAGKVGQDVRLEFRAAHPSISTSGPVLRATGRGNGVWYYLADVESNGSGLRVLIYRAEGGGLVLKASSAYVACGSGDVMCLEFSATGVTPVLLEARLWRKGIQARPAAAQASFSDSDQDRITAGYLGLRSNGGPGPSYMIDNLVWGDGTGGLNTFGGDTPSGPVITGNIQLDNAAPTGGLQSGSPSTLTGSITTDAAAPGGGLSSGAATGTVVMGPWRNKAGMALPNQLVTRLTLQRLVDGVQVLNLAGLTTSSSATAPQLSVTNAALVPGAWYVAVAHNADGTVLGVERVQAA
jgi:hypothetical protein